MSSENIEICPVCQVQIKDDRAKLWARVCQYVADKKEGCINQDPDKIGALKSTDSYKPMKFERKQ